MMMIGGAKSVSRVENAIAHVLLYASGLKSRPSRSPRKNIGRNDVRMISIENNKGRVILAVDRMIVARRSWALRPARFDNSVVQFSTITIVASAISPMAIASPAKENKLIVWPSARRG